MESLQTHLSCAKILSRAPSDRRSPGSLALSLAQGHGEDTRLQGLPRLWPRGRHFPVPALGWWPRPGGGHTGRQPVSSCPAPCPVDKARKSFSRPRSQVARGQAGFAGRASFPGTASHHTWKQLRCPESHTQTSMQHPEGTTADDHQRRGMWRVASPGRGRPRLGGCSETARLGR